MSRLVLSYAFVLAGGGIPLGCADDDSGTDVPTEAVEDGGRDLDADVDPEDRADDAGRCVSMGACSPPGARCMPEGTCWACSSWCYTTIAPDCTCSAAGAWQCSYWDCGGAFGECGGTFFCNSSCTTRCDGDGGTEDGGAEDGDTYGDGFD